MSTPVRTLSSASVSTGDPTKASQYNNLRSDAILAFTELDYGDTVDLPGSPALGQVFLDKQADILYACYDAGTWRGVASERFRIDGDYIDIDEVTTPGNPAANVARLYCRDDTGTTKLFFRDSGGTETEIGGTGFSPSTLDTDYGAETITSLFTFDRDPSPPFAVTAGSAAVANLDADKLDGQEGSFYRDADNLNAGTVPEARLPTRAYLGIITAATAMPATGTRFVTLHGVVGSATEGDAKAEVGTAITVRRLYCLRGDGTGTVTVTLRKNGADSALAVTLGSTVLSGQDNVDSIAFAINDDIDWQVVSSGVTGSSFIVIFAEVEVA